jgi:hypothetical protein
MAIAEMTQTVKVVIDGNRLVIVIDDGNRLVGWKPRCWNTDAETNTDAGTQMLKHRS